MRRAFFSLILEKLGAQVGIREVVFAFVDSNGQSPTIVRYVRTKSRVLQIADLLVPHLKRVLSGWQILDRESPVRI